MRVIGIAAIALALLLYGGARTAAAQECLIATYTPTGQVYYVNACASGSFSGATSADVTSSSQNVVTVSAVSGGGTIATYTPDGLVVFVTTSGSVSSFGSAAFTPGSQTITSSSSASSGGTIATYTPDGQVVLVTW